MSSKLGPSLLSFFSRTKTSLPKRPTIFSRQLHSLERRPSPNNNFIAALLHKQSHPNEVKSAKEDMASLVKLGYKPEHLRVTTEGHVVYDLEAVAHDAFHRAVEESQKKLKTPKKPK